MFKLLFTTDIPEHLRFKSFTLPHAVIVLGIVLLIYLAVKTVRQTQREQRQRVLFLFTWSLPAMYLLRFTVFALLDAFVEPQMHILDRLPLQLCTMNAIVMPLAVRRRIPVLLNYMYAICLPGAAAAMLTPAMSYYGLYAFFSWQVVFFFLDHGLMVLVPALAVAIGFFTPSIRQMPKALGIFALYAAAMYPLNKMTGQNFLFLNWPDQGTVMALFATRLGNPGYLLPLAALVVLIVCLMYLPWLFKRRRQ
jgi:hypothetical integral membrane protein (TIGR02206 family)